MTDLIDKVTDVQRTLTFSRRKLNLNWLGLGLLCFGIGVVFIFVKPFSFGAFDWMLTALALLLGGFMTGYALYRMAVPGKPLLTISPAGLRLYIEWVKDIDIPWHEVRGVDTIDITGRMRGRLLFAPGVTVVLVSKRFYDRYIHIDSWFLRGPGWEMNFIPKGDMVQVALHHSLLPATAVELRTAVETRWQAFRGDAPRPKHLPHVPPGGHG